MWEIIVKHLIKNFLFIVEGNSPAVDQDSCLIWKIIVRQVVKIIVSNMKIIVHELIKILF